VDLVGNVGREFAQNGYLSESMRKKKKSHWMTSKLNSLEKMHALYKQMNVQNVGGLLSYPSITSLLNYFNSDGDNDLLVMTRNSVQSHQEMWIQI